MYKKIHLISLFVLFSMFAVNCSSTKNISSNAKTTFANASMYEVNIRQFSPEGTFKQVEEQLPRLKSMGIGIVWLMPIHPIGEFNRKGTLGSYYSIRDYNAVNPEFGTMDDFKRLVKKCHDLGMFIIIDWVANHTSCDNVWLKTHPDWYTKDKAGNFQPPVADWSDVYDLNYDNPDLQAAMVEAMKFWVTETNIDGFRCDVAEMVPNSFWKKARLALNTLNKPIFLLAEGEKPELHANGFDATYDWTFHHLINDVAQNKKTVADLDNYFKTIATKYGRNDYRLQFTSNHDENSWNGTEYERLGAGVRAFAILTATIPGMPLVYSGQESAFKKRLKFFDKDPIDWSDYSMQIFYTNLLQFKNAHKALWNGSAGGDLVRINTTQDQKVFAFKRKKDTDEVLVMLNLSGDEAAVQFASNAPSGSYYNAFGAKSAPAYNIDAKSNFILKPWGYMVLYKK